MRKYLAAYFFVAALACSLAQAQILSPIVNFGKPRGVAPTTITTPIIGLGSQTAPSTAAATFFPLIQGARDGSNAANGRELPVAASGSISNLFASFPSGIGSGNWSVALTHSGAITGLTCQISGTTCSDTNAGHAVSITAGDTVGWVTCPGTISGGVCTPGTAPTSNGNIQVSASFASTNVNESFVAGGAANGASTSVFNYASLQGYTSTFTTTEANYSEIIPVGGTLDQFYVNLNVASGAAKSWTFTIMQNGTATSVTCNAANTTSCSDLADSITVGVNDTVSLQTCPGTVSLGVCTSLTPTGTTFRWGMRWKPSTSGQSLLLMADQVTMPSTGVNSFSYVNGVGNAGTGEASNQNIGPLSFTIKNLSVAFSTAPGAAQSRTFTLRTGTGGSQTSSALTCNVTNSTVTTSCQDSSHSVSITSGLFVNWLSAETGTPAAVTNYKVSAVMTVP